MKKIRCATLMRARLVDCFELSTDTFKAHAHRHCVATWPNLRYKDQGRAPTLSVNQCAHHPVHKAFAWVLEQAERFEKPFAYGLRTGAVVWGGNLQACHHRECQVCGQALPRNAFPAATWKYPGKAMRTSTLRCTACHCCATCRQIKKVRAFTQNAQDCNACQQNTETWHYDADDKMLQ